MGTVYSRLELKALSEFCKANDLLLWLDGARLCAALAADEELSLQNIAEFADIFWIGGTKAGCLAAEAIVVTNPALGNDLSFVIKQRGAMLSKGRLLGCQFAALFQDDLYLRAAHHAHEPCTVAGRGNHQGQDTNCKSIARAIRSSAILPKPLIKTLLERFDFYVLQELQQDEAVVRLVTSWATDKRQLATFVSLLTG